jgi:hypothetical protein
VSLGAFDVFLDLFMLSLVSSRRPKSTEVECGESLSYRSSGGNCSEDVMVEKDKEINGI